VLRVLRQEGLRGVVRRLLGHSRREMVFVERDLDQSDDVPFLPRQPFVMKFLTSDELDVIRPHVTPERFEAYRRRIARGMNVAACLSPDERECLGWVWTTDQACFEPFDNATYRAVPGDMLHIDGEVVSERRGRGVAFTAYPLMWSFWRRRGARMIHCTIDVENKPSLKIHDRMNYRQAEHMVVHTLLGFKWSRPAGPRLGPGDETGRA
jgi:hypothetical protein